MKEATATQKYGCGKGTAHRVEKDLDVLSNLHEGVGQQKER